MPTDTKKQRMELKFEVKNHHQTKSDDGEFAEFEGYASTFGNVDSMEDVIEPGAFKECISKKPRLKMLWQHNWSSPIGSFMDMKEDSHGLFVKGRINLGTEKGREAYALLKAGDLDSMSIGYFVKGYDYNRETHIRTLKEIDLFEISLVSIPANEMALVSSVKSAIDESESVLEIESILRTQGGFSRKESKALISRIKELSADTKQRDADKSADENAKESQRDAGEDVGLKSLLEGIQSLAASIQKPTNN